MADHSQPPRPPEQAEPPRDTVAADGTHYRNARPEHDASPAVSGAEPRTEDLGPRSFAGENAAGDQRRQARERGEGLGAGGSDNRDARYGTPRDGSDVPEDDIA